MHKVDKKKWCAYVSAFGYLGEKKETYHPEGKAKYLLVEVGEIRCTVYGRAYDDFAGARVGALVFIEGELFLGKHEWVVQIARHRFLDGLFPEVDNRLNNIEDVMAQVVESNKPKLRIESV